MDPDDPVCIEESNNFQNGRESDPQFLEALPCRHSAKRWRLFIGSRRVTL